MGNKTLFIFYYYGEGYAAGIQNRRLINGLEGHMFNYEIIYRYSKSNTNTRAIQVSAPKCEYLNKVINFILPGVIPVVRLDEILWTILVMLKIHRRYDEFNSIHITSSPFFVQLIGRYFSEKKKLKWIVQLLDPISDNFYINMKGVSKNMLSILEKIVIERADLVITNNSRLDAIIRKRYYAEKSKFVIIPQITDDSLYGTTKWNKKLTIVHSGGLYGFRTLDYLIDSVKIFNYKYENSDSFEIEIIGNCSQKEKEKVRNSRLDNQIKFFGYLERRELYLRLTHADVLLVIDALDQSGIFFPSKLCEYFSLRKIVFAITPKESVTSDLLIEAKHLCFGNGEEEKFADSLSNLVRDRNYYNQFNKDYFKRYLQNNVARNYLSAIETIGLDNRIQN